MMIKKEVLEGFRKMRLAFRAVKRLKGRLPSSSPKMEEAIEEVGRIVDGEYEEIIFHTAGNIRQAITNGTYTKYDAVRILDELRREANY